MSKISLQKLADSIPSDPWISLSEEIATNALICLIGDVTMSFSSPFEAGRRLPMGQRPWVCESDSEPDDEVHGDTPHVFSGVWMRLILWSAMIRRIMVEHGSDGVTICEPVKFTRAEGRLRMSFSFYLRTGSGEWVGVPVP